MSLEIKMYLTTSDFSEYGNMNDKDIRAAATIAMNCIGSHFSKSVSDYLMHRIQMSTEI